MPGRRSLDRGGGAPDVLPVRPEQPMLRVEQLPRGAGWMLITAGVVGLVVPGVPGAPFLLAGVILLTPGGSRFLSQWAGRNPPKFVHSAMRPISRFLDDLERRYPRTRSPWPIGGTNRASETR